jgi:hypothetical protein
VPFVGLPPEGGRDAGTPHDRRGEHQLAQLAEAVLRAVLSGSENNP